MTVRWIKFRLSRRWRRFLLMIHILASVGWFGLGLAVSVLEVATLGIADADTLRTAYRFHELLVSTMIIPCAISTVITGIALSVGTPWGLLKYYWPPAKLVLTVATIAVTVANSPEMISFAIANADSPGSDLTSVQQGLVGLAAFHLAALAVATWLSLYKPFGRIKKPGAVAGGIPDAAREPRSMSVSP